MVLDLENPKKEGGAEEGGWRWPASPKASPCVFPFPSQQQGDDGEKHVRTSMKDTYHKKAGKFFGKGILKKLLEKRAAAKLAAVAACEATSVELFGQGAAASMQPLADAGVALPPLPPPALELEEVIEYAGGLKLGANVRIWSDRHGKQWCNKTGVVKSFTSNLSLVVETDTLQRQTVMIDEVELVSCLKAVVPAKNLRQITGALREQWLMECGFGSEIRLVEESFSASMEQLKGKADVYVTTEQLTFFWSFTHWALEWPDGIEYIDPQLMWAWVNHDGEGEEGERDQQLKWRAMWQKLSRKGVKLMLMPLTVSDHWTLLVVQCSSLQVQYYDSLKFESESGWMVADMLLSKLKQEALKEGLEHLQWLPDVCPHRCNEALQGTLQCGYFVAWWMEEEVRELQGQGRWCRGWPNAMQTRQSMQKVMANAVAASMKMQNDLQRLQDEDNNEIKKLFAAGILKAKFASIAEMEKDLCASASSDLAAGFKGEASDIAMHMMQDQTMEAWAESISPLLLPAHQAKVQQVKETGIGICSKCRWESGCSECCWWKTVRYFRMKETRGKFMEAYGEAYQKQVGPKGKKLPAKGGGAPTVIE